MTLTPPKDVSAVDFALNSGIRGLTTYILSHSTWSITDTEGNMHQRVTGISERRG